jgi:hypothetical protein
MLRLTWEQFDRLEQLTLKRHAASISGVLAQTWPALTERLQDRWPASSRRRCNRAASTA